MTDLIPGKRYRFTVEGVANDIGLVVRPNVTMTRAWFSDGTLEALPDPLPTAPGSVVLDRKQLAWQRREYCWASTLGEYPASSIEHFGPFTVLFDAGVES